MERVTVQKLQCIGPEGMITEVFYRVMEKEDLYPYLLTFIEALGWAIALSSLCG